MQSDDETWNSPASLVTKKVSGTFPKKYAMFILALNFTSEKRCQSAVKHSAAFKLNQQINDKDGEKKK